eukprot:TRINITY_DN142_c0_g3_i1.p1 TRINITY_DN142_c0_g3~~TRINITY_DN142_c0_g3_i1.p1  ORF type:complete len:317 (+),score=36.98 TRINITY_DN142_c0_g3_i1:399-1349(+)
MAPSGSEAAWAALVEQCQGTLTADQLVLLTRDELRRLLADLGVPPLQAARAEVQWQVQQQTHPAARSRTALSDIATPPSEAASASAASGGAPPGHAPSQPPESGAGARRLLSPPRPGSVPAPLGAARHGWGDGVIPSPRPPSGNIGCPAGRSASPRCAAAPQAAGAARASAASSPRGVTPASPLLSPAALPAQPRPAGRRSYPVAHPKEWSPPRAESPGPHLSRKRLLSPCGRNPIAAPPAEAARSPGRRPCSPMQGTGPVPANPNELGAGARPRPRRRGHVLRHFRRLQGLRRWRRRRRRRRFRRPPRRPRSCRG